MITLAGAMSTAQIGRSLAPAIREGKIHAISCTGANLEEDLFQLIGGTEYHSIPNWRYLSPEDEKSLHDSGMNRVTDTCIPEESTIEKIIPELVKIWQEKSRFPHEHLFEFIERLSDNYEFDNSWLVAAKDMKIPIYVPGWEDSTLGNIFTAHCIKGELHHDRVKTGVQAMMHLADWYSQQTSKVGLLQVGGGIAGDFPICVVPLLNQDLGKNVNKWSWFAQISDSTTSYGGYSGAPPNEKISWGKLEVQTPKFMIESDATIVLPLLLESLNN
tara:strand:- start:4123 stop:4941 length:819 start_codon:yes stop_codon:yes gene_type:complete